MILKCKELLLIIIKNYRLLCRINIKIIMKTMTVIAVFVYLTILLTLATSGYSKILGQRPLDNNINYSGTDINNININLNKNLSDSDNLNKLIYVIKRPYNKYKLYKHDKVQSKVKKFSKYNNNELFISGTVSATPKPISTYLNDLFISVKTTKTNHLTRLPVQINTWYQLAKDQTWFFSDADDDTIQTLTNGHLINTNCSVGHIREALCCKMSAELDSFLESGKKWFCHFDDDNYVNVPRLLNLLDGYNPSMDWYLGKPSVSSPLEIYLESKDHKWPEATTKFWFATGGAGFCISRALGLKMLPIAGGGKFISIGDRIRFPDDVTMGFVIENLLKVPLTVIEGFHSHLEQMEFIHADTFQSQVSFSYARTIDNDNWNVLQIDGGINKIKDPTRFYSLHCYLFPQSEICTR